MSVTTSNVINDDHSAATKRVAELKNQLKEFKLLESMDKSETLRLRSTHVG